MRVDWDEEWFQALFRLGLVGERERWEALAQGSGMAFADLDRICLESDTLALIPVAMARELRVLPLKRDGKTLWVALDTLNTTALAKVGVTTGQRIVSLLCMPIALDEALDRLTSEPPTGSDK